MKRQKIVCETCGHIARSENALDHSCEEVIAKRKRDIRADDRRRKRLVKGIEILTGVKLR